MPEQITINLGHVWLAVKVVAGILIARQEFKYPFFQGGVETVRPLHVVLRRVLRNIAVNPEWGFLKLLAFIPSWMRSGTKHLSQFLPWSVSPKCPDCNDKGWFYDSNFIKPGRTRQLAGVAFPSLSHHRTLCKCKAGEAEQGPPVVAQPDWPQTVGICVNCDKPLPDLNACTCSGPDFGVVRGCPLLYRLGMSTSTPYWVINCDSDFVKSVSMEPLFHCDDPDRTGVYQNDDFSKAEAKWIVLVNLWSRYVLNKNEERPAERPMPTKGQNYLQ